MPATAASCALTALRTCGVSFNPSRINLHDCVAPVRLHILFQFQGHLLVSLLNDPLQEVFGCNGHAI